MVEWKKRVITASIVVPILLYSVSFKISAVLVAHCKKNKKKKTKSFKII
jgi:hypothetical protein